MEKPRFYNIGRGVYTLAEAQLLTGVPTWSIRRWTGGYTYKYRGEYFSMPPVIGRRPDDGDPVLSFADLVEVRFLNAFRSHGASWRAIRIASREAQKLLKLTHPFSTNLFRTDGRTILGKVNKDPEDVALLDMLTNQYAFERVVKPFLYDGLDFDDDFVASRWWPLGKKRRVVIDPERSFGAPIGVKSGIPTSIIYKAMKAEDSIEFVSRWYKISKAEIKDAVTFEARPRLAA